GFETRLRVFFFKDSNNYIRISHPFVIKLHHWYFPFWTYLQKPLRFVTDIDKVHVVGNLLFLQSKKSSLGEWTVSKNIRGTNSSLDTDLQSHLFFPLSFLGLKVEMK
ncbi:hypothetical protein SQ11_16160, partial [Nitrosospira sp. NpAV]